MKLPNKESLLCERARDTRHAAMSQSLACCAFDHAAPSKGGWLVGTWLRSIHDILSRIIEVSGVS